MDALPYRIYNVDRDNNTKTLVGATVYAEDAAALVAVAGNVIAYEFSNNVSFVVWRDGYELQHAYESYDNVARVIHERITERLKRITKLD